MADPTTRTVVHEHEAELLVQKAEVVAEDVVALTLVSPAGETLPSWSPGAHIDLVLADDLVRQYSLCSSPGEDGAWRIGVLRTPDSRGGSQRVHDTLTEGATVTIRGPRNHFPLVAASTYLFIAGGIGITPMLPMIAQAEAAGADWRLLYGGRHRASMAFLPELAQYGDRVTVVPQDEAGFLDLDGVLGTPQEGTLVYCCGPEGLLSAVEAKCAKWPSGSLHLERFSAKPQETSEVARRELRARPAADRRHCHGATEHRASSRPHSRPVPTSSAPAWRASAAPARPRSSRATSTIATPSSTRRSGPPTSS